MRDGFHSVLAALEVRLVGVRIPMHIWFSEFRSVAKLSAAQHTVADIQMGISQGVPCGMQAIPSMTGGVADSTRKMMIVRCGILRLD